MPAEFWIKMITYLECVEGSSEMVDRERLEPQWGLCLAGKEEQYVSGGVGRREEPSCWENGEFF